MNGKRLITAAALLMVLSVPAHAQTDASQATDAHDFINALRKPSFARVVFLDMQNCIKGCAQETIVFSLGNWRVGATCVSAMLQSCARPEKDPDCVGCNSPAWIALQKNNIDLGVEFISKKSGAKPEKIGAGHLSRWHIERITNVATGMDSNPPAKTFDDAMRPTLGPNQ